MTLLNDTLLGEFQSQLHAHYKKNEGSGQFQKVKAKSWDHFQELGLPSKNMEVYRYVKLRKLYSQSFLPVERKVVAKSEIDRHILPGFEKSLVVFINGHYHPELSTIVEQSGPLVALPLEKAVKTYGAFLNSHLALSMKSETDPFVSLNGALHSDGMFLYLPPNTVLEQPIQILNLIDTADASVIISPRVHIFVGAQSQMDVTILNKCVSGETYFCNQYLDLVIEKGSQVNLHQINAESPKSSWTFDALRAILKRDSTLRTISITNGSATVRNDYHVQLTGENAEASLNGLWMLKEAREAHANVLIDHQAPHCRSMQLFKGVLNDTSRSSFEGKILVRQPAQKTDAFQLNNNLLLSDRANADSKPNLEIFADDVKASHGATVGQLDREQMFYLRARGFSSDLAKRILVNGFCKEVIDLIKAKSLKEIIRIQECI